MKFFNLVNILCENTKKPKTEIIVSPETDMTNVFGVLLNDQFFNKQFQKIFSKFKEDVQTFTSIDGFDTYNSGIKNIERLEKNIQKYNDNISSLELELGDKNKMINRANLSPSEKNKMEMDIDLIDRQIKTLKTQKRRESTNKRKLEFDNKISQLESLLSGKKIRYSQALMSKSELEKLKVDVFDIGKRIKTQQSYLDKCQATFDEIMTSIDNISMANRNINDDAFDSLVELVQFTASKLLKEYGEINDSDLLTELQNLMSEDSNVNPILNYIQNSNTELDEFSFINPSKLPFSILKSIYTDIKSNNKINLDKISKQTKTSETFDESYRALLSNRYYDDDDFKLDVMEILEKCTGPTKKAHSTRKGKKWMKCARQSDGSYKRIHWGQAGVRVTGKSGNTKRKKSFKKRHGCSSAKPGTPKAMACKDWA